MARITIATLNFTLKQREPGAVSTVSFEQEPEGGFYPRGGLVGPQSDEMEAPAARGMEAHRPGARGGHHRAHAGHVHHEHPAAPVGRHAPHPHHAPPPAPHAVPHHHFHAPPSPLPPPEPIKPHKGASPADHSRKQRAMAQAPLPPPRPQEGVQKPPKHIFPHHGVQGMGPFLPRPGAKVDPNKPEPHAAPAAPVKRHEGASPADHSRRQRALHAAAEYRIPLSGSAARRGYEASVGHMDPEFRARLAAMMHDHPGTTVFSGWRSEADQERIRRHARAGYAAKGTSQHTRGMAADLRGGDLAWFHRHAAEYGLKFPMLDPRRRPYEPWHIEKQETRGGPRWTGHLPPGPAAAQGAPPSEPAKQDKPASHKRLSEDRDLRQWYDIAPRLMADLRRDYGLTREQAAGVVGHFGQETAGFKAMQEAHPLVPGSRGGYGYGQWTGPRRRAFEAYAATHGGVNSYEANYGFLKQELENPEFRKYLDAVRRAHTVSQATHAFYPYVSGGDPRVRAAFDSRMRWANRAYLGSLNLEAARRAAEERSRLLKQGERMENRIPDSYHWAPPGQQTYMRQAPGDSRKGTDHFIRPNPHPALGDEGMERDPNEIKRKMLNRRLIEARAQLAKPINTNSL